MSKAAPGAQTDDETLQLVRKRLMETGDWDRIARLLADKLRESGWEDDLKDLAKGMSETARGQERPNLEGLLREVRPKADAMVDKQIRAAVLQELEAVLDREVEHA